jgi:hypothetical protein
MNPLPNPSPHPSRVSVHNKLTNPHKGCAVVKAQEPPPEGASWKRDRVHSYHELVELRNASTKISLTAHKRVLAGNREVYAYFIGEWVRDDPTTPDDPRAEGWTRVRFQPYELGPEFVRTDTGEPLTSAPRIVIAGGAAWIPPGS